MAGTTPKKSKGKPRRYVIIVSRFNEFIGERLLTGCLEEFRKNGVAEERLEVVSVPGAFEIPVAAQAFARKRDVLGVVCLGAVIRGETFHFDLVAGQCARGIMDVSLATGKPVVFGVLTTETVKQAYARSEAKGDHKGREAARVALEMTTVLQDAV